MPKPIRDIAHVEPHQLCDRSEVFDVTLRVTPDGPIVARFGCEDEAKATELAAALNGASWVEME